jgi:hypothetical protein
MKPKKPLESLILTVRGHQVLMDADLAEIYGVPTKVFNQAIKRNAERFPEDFCFRLILKEAEDVQRSRSQFEVNLAAKTVGEQIRQHFLVNQRAFDRGIWDLPSLGSFGKTGRAIKKFLCPYSFVSLRPKTSLC